MTTPSTERKAGPLLGTGAQTTWPFTFKVFAATDIAVTIADSLGVETALVYGTDYSVALNANQETSPGGTVTYPISGSALPVGKRLVIFGNLPYDQPLDLPAGGNFSPLALENELDRLTMQIQQLREQVGRSLQVSVTTSADVGLPAPSANELIGWDSTGSNLQNFALGELATAVAYATMRYDTFTGDGVETQFTLTADPVTLANLDVAISGVTQVPGTDYSLLNGVLVFTSAPANGTQILARYGEGLVNVGGDSSDIRFLQAGTGAVDRPVQNKLREVICVDDFGADPTGATDSTTAIRNAFNAIKSRGGVLTFRDGGAYLVSGPFGTSTANTSDYANNVTIDGRNATLTVNATTWPVGNTPVITLEGNNVAVKNLNFISTVAFEQYNTDPLSYRTRTIIGVMIGGKAASYNAMPDNLTYYKKNAIVDHCTFNNIHSPIIATASSFVKVTNNYIYSYNTTAIVGWNCPEDLEVAFNQVKLGADDCISVGMLKASLSAWTTAGNEAGNCRIHDNYLGYTRARCIGFGGYSNVIVSNNQCEKTLLSGIAIHGDPNLYATGAQYNRNIIIHNNIIRDAGRFYDTTSAVVYWQGPVSQENNAIGTFGYSGTRGVSVLPREITISNNYIQNPSGAAFYLYMLDGVRVINNTATPGTLNQGSGNVNTNGSVFTTVSVTGVLIQNNASYPGQGVNWLYTYTISSTALTAGNMHIRGNYALDQETFDPGNETPAGGLIAYTCLDKNNRMGSGLQQPTHFYQQLHQPGADRLMLSLAVQGATNGFSVKWDHAKLKTIVNLADLPTSSAGLASGDLWNSVGTLRIV